MGFATEVLPFRETTWVLPPGLCHLRRQHGFFHLGKHTGIIYHLKKHISYTKLIAKELKKNNKNDLIVTQIAVL